jgi:hypothetical protein
MMWPVNEGNGPAIAGPFLVSSLMNTFPENSHFLGFPSGGKYAFLQREK